MSEKKPELEFVVKLTRERLVAIQPVLEAWIENEQQVRPLGKIALDLEYEDADALFPNTINLTTFEDSTLEDGTVVSVGVAISVSIPE